MKPRIFSAALASLLFTHSAQSQTLYWDNNGDTSDFGTAAGTWADPTTGNSTQGWSTSSAGTLLPGDVTTSTANTLTFGNATTGLLSGNITVSGTVEAGNLTFASATENIGLLGGSITLGATPTISVNGTTTAGVATISSNLLGGGAISKTGTGMLVLSGTNTISTIALAAGGGTLRFANTAAVPSTRVTLVSGTSLQFGTDTSTTLAAVTSTLGTIVSDRATAGAGLTHNITILNIGTGSTGTVFEKGANVTSGQAVIEIGSVTNNNGSVSSPALTANTANVNITGSVTLGGGNAGTANFTLGGTGSVNSIGGGILKGTRVTSNVTKSGTSTWVLSGASDYNGTTSISGGTLAGTAAVQSFGTNLSGITLGASGTLSLRNNGDVTFTNGTSAYNINNSASGATINVDRVSGTGTNTLTVGNLTTTSTAAVWSGNFTGANGTSLSAATLSTPVSTVAATHTINNNIAGGGSLTLASVFNQATIVASPELVFTGTGSANTTVTGAITQTISDMRLTKSGVGTLTLGGNNTYTGVTTISGGTLQIGSGGTSGDIASTTGVTNNGALIYNRSNAIAAGYDISGNGSLTKLGTGTLTLSGNNSYSGATLVDGTGLSASSRTLLTVSHNNAFGSTTGGTKLIATVAASHETRMILSDGITVTGEHLTIDSTGGRAVVRTDGTAAWAGNVTIDSNVGGFLQFTANGVAADLTVGASATDTFTLNGNATFRGIGNSTINSTVQGSGGVLQKIDSGTLVLTAANTHTSNTVVAGGGTGGVVRLANSLAVQDSTFDILTTGSVSALTFDSAVVSNAFTLGGLSATAAGNAKNIALQNNAITPAAIALSVGNNDQSTTYDGIMSAGGSLTKIGTGTLTLGGVNSYTGATTVDEGTLTLSATGSIANSASVKVASGATLDVSAQPGGWTVGGGSNTQKLTGSGNVTGATIIAGTANNGIHNVGDATVGKQTFSSSLTYNSGSIFEWDLNANSETGRGTSYDAVDVTTLNVDSGAIFKVVLGSGVTADPFWTNPAVTRTWSDIFSFTTLVGSFNTADIVVTGPGAANTGMGSFSITGTSLTWTAVPEPTTALAGLLLGAGLLRRRRGRNVEC